ncbi:sodium/chloride dependent amino acid transporter, putative [Ixodes scapularis]|nr:sodium/chloride dependent amino acid transporter, putative [Ixodes scapularis]|eukprot:XP_002416004.1 sodium/chloride dependent amino acid transporter, putative [Ixodes scapularis]
MLDQKDPLKYGKYVYPSWAVGIGWAITLFVMLQIPFWAAVSIYRAPGNTFLQKLRRATRPSPAWGPSDASLKDQWKVATGQTAPGIKVELRKFTPGETTNDLGGVENKAYTVSEQDAH